MKHINTAYLMPLLVPVSVVAVGIFMAAGPGEAALHDDPWGKMPQRVPHVDHSAFFDPTEFEDIKDDLEAISHRVTQKCLRCHPDAASEVMKTSHWHWRGEEVEVANHEGTVRIGKANLLNNFCISVESNWPRCTSCHIGYGWADESFDFDAEENVDCLICHDTTGSYRKNPTGAGYPAEPPVPDDGGSMYRVENLLGFAQKVGYPNRDNCGVCHFAGGGGDAVKHGDLNGFMYNPSERIDVHMGRHDLVCTDCHRTEDHDIRGRSMAVSVDAKNLVFCTDCHEPQPHRQERLNAHTHTVACQTCHIPTIAVGAPTKTSWDWSTAGLTQEEAAEQLGITDPHLYNPKKGTFTYGEDLTPEYYWYDGTAERYLRGDVIDPDAELVQINRPRGDVVDPNARIFPFKVHRGKQAYDLKYLYLLIPRLYGEGGFWPSKTRDPEQRWHGAFVVGAEVHGMPYSGTETGQPSFGWASTEMYWPQSHMVAPASQALQCNDCHGEYGHEGRMDWDALGYEGDPAYLGGRVQMDVVKSYGPWTREAR